jgi:hypothetical protein
VVQKTCRDANEEHDSSYQDGCKKYEVSIPFEEPMERADAEQQCWEVSHFADPDAVSSKYRGTLPTMPTVNTNNNPSTDSDCPGSKCVAAPRRGRRPVG